MRLRQNEASVIINTARELLGQHARIWLFGSRVDDTAQGGDIDLYIEVPGFAPDQFMLAVRLTSLLQLKLGEQKFDILIRGANDKLEPIHDIARTQGIELL